MSPTFNQIVLITSNRGANAGGEEYNRRIRMVRFQDEIVLRYTPRPRQLREPFRKYNTHSLTGYMAIPEEIRQRVAVVLQLVSRRRD